MLTVACIVFHSFACRSAAYGEMARECAEAYFQYGSSLLELARMEQGVLGNALDGGEWTLCFVFRRVFGPSYKNIFFAVFHSLI